MVLYIRLVCGALVDDLMLRGRVLVVDFVLRLACGALVDNFMLKMVCVVLGLVLGLACVVLALVCVDGFVVLGPWVEGVLLYLRIGL